MRYRCCHFLLRYVARVLLLVIGLGLCPSASADELQWSTPLGELPGENRDQALVVVLITNDVSTEWESGRVSRRASFAEKCWCGESFLRAVSDVPSGFFHPSAPVYWQHWPLGLPHVLTGGENVTGPGRCAVVVTDGFYRILEFFVGVPDRGELTALIGDAEDTRRWMRQHTKQPSEFTKQIADRNRQRINRLWKLELDQQLVAMGESSQQKVAGPIEEAERFTEEAKVRLSPLATQLQKVYLKDVQLRFGLTELSDFERLVILEQHSATRLAWTSVMAPFIAGADLRSVYEDLVEIVWDRKMMSLRRHEDDSASDDALDNWISRHGDQDPFAFEIQLPRLSRSGQRQRVPVSEVAERHGLGWKDLDSEIKEVPIRQVTTRELATWLTRHERRPIDVRRPSHARFLFFRSATDRPYPIRDGEPPARSITMIRQVKR
ncbi:hypothetical protein [Rhodopirellula sp. SWK7]|uniref:hypothetical protein n=1 Tax=Rhodopirellula sp. SWK7 TaxID=595460 RepID=UPI00034D093E|nr:hypothetical protein [Rhodopirellula sp. SWK7]